MKRKPLVLLFTFFIMVITCFTFTACDEYTLENLSTKNGITIEGSGFEKGHLLTAEEIDETSNQGASILTSIANQTYNKDKDVYIYDISVKTQDGEVVQPNGKVKVTIPAPVNTIFNYVVFHIKDSATVEVLVASYSNNKISFETDSFSYFVVAEKATFSFRTLVGEGRGTISYNNEVQPNGYFGNDLEAGAKVTLKATAETGYEFTGWFLKDETATNTLEFEDTAISTEATYEFTIPAEDYTVYAVFTAKITSLKLDSANAGFDQTATETTVTIGQTNLPKPEDVLVKGVSAVGEEYLTKDVDYEISLGGLDFTTAGTYTITYTYKKDQTISATLIVKVVVDNTV